MKKITKLIVASAVVVGALAAAGWQVSATSKVGAQGYFYAYPLVLMELTKRHQLAMGMTGINEFSHRKVFPDHTFNSVVAPNVDTLYSSARLDLSVGPMVMTLPSTEGFYYMVPILDAWTNVIASPGTRNLGSAPARYLITGPDWSGSVPDGYEQIQSPTNMAWVLGRIKSSGPSDYKQVNALQERLGLHPLDADSVSASPPIDMPDLLMDKAPDKQIGDWSMDEFYTAFCQLLDDNPAPAADEPMLQQLRSAGLLTDDCSVTGNPVKRLGLQLGYDKALGVLSNTLQILQQQVPPGEWHTVYDLGDYAQRYVQRALVAKVGLGANGAEDAVYSTATTDSRGDQLDGNSSYQLHFSADELPPVNGFWSLTMYDTSRMLVGNQANRYAIGDRNDLHFAEDGSLTLYVQNDRPADANQARNWLPAPKQPFNLILRLYWPGPEILNALWQPPVIERVD